MLRYIKPPWHCPTAILSTCPVPTSQPHHDEGSDAMMRATFFGGTLRITGWKTIIFDSPELTIWFQGSVTVRSLSFAQTPVCLFLSLESKLWWYVVFGSVSNNPWWSHWSQPFCDNLRLVDGVLRFHFMRHHKNDPAARCNVGSGVAAWKDSNFNNVNLRFR